MWKDIPGFPGYKVSDTGDILGPGRGGYQSRVGGAPVCQKLNNGYLVVRLYDANGNRKDRLAHRLVLTAFVGPPANGTECRHLNNVKTDNRLENLAWGTRVENAGDSIDNYKRGVSHHNAKLSDREVLEARIMRGQGFSYPAIAKRFGVVYSTIRKAIRGDGWSHVGA